MPVRDRIVAYLEACVTASPREIGASLGDADPVMVRQTLGRMTEASILERVGYGKYALCPGYQRRTVSVGSDTEALIYSVLIDHGGIAVTRDIHKAVWGGERAKGDRPYDYVRVMKALRVSERIGQNFGKGVWNLAEGERAALPMRGRWVGLVQGLDSAKTRNAFFQDVGAAFCDARGERSLADVAGDSAIAGALGQMADIAPGAERKALKLQLADQEAGEDVLPVAGYSYWLFEQGEPDLHMAATATFYRDCARLFGVDAAALSRRRCGL
jgi:hypothetical protein